MYLGRVAFGAVLFVTATMPNLASGEVLTAVQKDEIAGTEIRYVILRAENYKSFTNENEIRFACHPGGRLEIRWTYGSRYSDDRAYTMIYRIDSGDPLGFVLSDPPDLRQLIDDLRQGALLIAKNQSSDQTYRFSLSGTSRAFATFKPQCLTD